MAKKEKRSLFSKIFGTNNSTTPPKNSTTLQFLDGYRATFTQYDGKDYDDADVRTCVDTIARNAAKFNPKHIKYNSIGFNKVNGNLQRILSRKPNELQNAYDFYYQVISELYLYNNSFVYVIRDENLKVLGLYPLHFQTIDFYEYANEIYIQFSFGTGKKRFVNIKDVIHLKRFVNKNSLLGGNNAPIKKVLSIKHVMDEGIINAIKITQAIRGVIKSTKSMLSPKDVKKMRDQFVEDFINSSDGLGGLDATTDFKEVNLNPVTATAEQVNSIDEKVLSYFSLNKNIVQSKYNEDEWNAFYESVLEPLALQMSLEFSNKIFSTREISQGNDIIFTSNKLQYSSNNTKTNLLRYGNNIFMVDEIREFFNMEPLPNGEGQRVLQDLNHIDSKIANEYQVGTDPKKEGEKNE